MPDRIRWITHKDKRILLIDYSGLRGEEALPFIQQVPSFYKDQPKGSVLCLIDVRNAYATQDVISALNTMVKTTTRPYDKKVAILGIAGAKKVLLITVNMISGHTIKPFDDEQQALDWLVS